MRIRSLFVVTAFLATAAVAQETKPPANSNQPPTADSPKDDAPEGEAPKGYGYGEQPGTAARGDSTSQGNEPGRAKSKMPQDQRPSSGKVGEGGEGEDASVAGRVVSVSPKSVTVRGEDGKEQQLGVTSSTVVLREGQRIDVSRLKAGDEVRASLEAGAGGRVASRITVHTGDGPMQAGPSTGESVDTPDQARGGVGGHIENTHPDPEPPPAPKP